MTSRGHISSSISKNPKEEMFSIRFDEILQVEGKEEEEEDEEYGRLPLPNIGQAAGRR